MSARLRAGERGHSRVLGLGGHRPGRVVTNAEICARIDSTAEWIEQRSGIRARRFAEPDETLLAMALSASGKALADAGTDPSTVDLVLTASMSNLTQTPPLAYAVGHELGAHGAGGFDISGACAGFCHAVGAASDAVSAGSARTALVVGVERMTDIVDPADRAIAFLFADGAGAVVIGPSAEPGIGPTIRGADGDRAHALRMTTSWGAFRADPALPEPMMKMDGRAVFRWALEQVVPAARKALAAAGLGPDDLAAFVPHQANLRMIELMADRLRLPGHVVVAADVRTSGNTSAASIPLALDELVRTGRVPSGAPALLAGFGAGLNYAAQVVLTP